MENSIEIISWNVNGMRAVGNKEALNWDEINRYSWWSYRSGARLKNVGWRIDDFFISEDLCENLEDAFILEHITGSDHCPVGIKISL